MIIEDVPIESVRNLNPNLRDNDRSSLTYLSFSLVGLMQETVLEVTPAFFNFSEILSINTLYKYINEKRHSIQIKNKSKADTNFSISLKRKSNEDLKYELSLTKVFIYA